MAVGPVALTLYCEMARDGVLKKGMSVCEIGSLDVVASSYAGLITTLFNRMGSPAPSPAAVQALAQGASRELMQKLGLSYACIDTDGRHGALVLDLNFDKAPPDYYGYFDLVANHGTTEHVFNQENSFRVIHDLTRVGGLMLHCVPFRGYADHCFFGYHPDLFEALARANGYEILGMWVTFGDASAHLVPWSNSLFDHLSIKQNTNVLLSALLRRRFDAAFQIPFQIAYETTNIDENAKRYRYVVNGDILDGRAIKRYAVGAATATSADISTVRFLKTKARRLLGRIKRGLLQ